MHWRPVCRFGNHKPCIVEFSSFEDGFEGVIYVGAGRLSVGGREPTRLRGDSYGKVEEEPNECRRAICWEVRVREKTGTSIQSGAWNRVLELL